MPFFMGAFPLAVMVLLIVWVKMPIHKSVLITLALVLAITGLYFHTPVEVLTNSVIYGVLKGLWPIVIVIFGAIFSYNLMLKTGSITIIRNLLSRVSDDQRILIILIAWCFGSFLEGAAGFSTAVAIPLGILIALGFDPIRAAVAALVADTASTVFGAVGIPVTVAGDILKLPIVGSMGISALTVFQLAIMNIVLPFLLVIIITKSVKALKGVFLITLITGIATLIPEYFIALYVGPQLTAFGGALVSMVVLLALVKMRRQETPAEYRIVRNDDNAPVYTKGQIARAVSIYVLMFVFILVSSPLFPEVKALLNSVATTFSFPMGGTRVLHATFNWIATPGMLIIFATFIGGIFFQKAKLSTFVSTLGSTALQLKNSTIAIATIVAMATVMDVTGLIAIVAKPLFEIAGPHYPYLAPLIGAVGTFVTGSVTNANVLFGNLQTIAASNLHIDPSWLVAANSAGATATKMIAPQSIAIAVSSAGLVNQDSTLMKGTAPWALLYIVVVILMSGLFAGYFLV